MNWDDLVPVAERAGRAIIDIYHSSFKVRTKEDKSPLTEADIASQDIITKELKKSYPVLSEEALISFDDRNSWKTFWLVDPLDGTKEFINRNGEFTINIALIKNGFPILGLLYAPAIGSLFGAEDGVAFTLKDGKRHTIRVSAPKTPMRILVSRFHQSAETAAFISRLPSSTTVEAGSALKFCRLAEGSADIYPRFAPTMEWDTAAGQAILEAAGGCVLDITGKRLEYNKKDLTNPSFIAYGDPSLRGLGKGI